MFVLIIKVIFRDIFFKSWFLLPFFSKRKICSDEQELMIRKNTSREQTGGKHSQMAIVLKDRIQVRLEEWHDKLKR